MNIIGELGQLSRYSDGKRAGWRGFNSREGQEIFLHSTASRPGSGAHSASYPIRSGVFPLGANRPGRAADHSPPSSAEVKNGGAIPPLPHMTSWRGA
jgi:hypothetical protein